MTKSYEDILQHISWLENGENSLCLIFKNSETNRTQLIQTTAQTLRESKMALIEVIPAYDSITFVYDSHKLTSSELRTTVEDLLTQFKDNGVDIKQHIIPVCYDSEVATDIVELSKRLKITTEQLIKLHTNTTYTTEMLGFLPGFIYLSGLDEKLHQPRKTTPAVKIPEGSIAIGGTQTGIYSLSSPGGWWIIGRTAAKLFDANAQPPIEIKPMDEIVFEAIDRATWEKMNRL